LLLIAGRLAAQEPVTLRLTPTAGQTSRYRTGLVMFLTMSGYQPADTSRPFMVQCLEATRSVTAVRGDTALLRTVTDSARVDMPGSPGMMADEIQHTLRGLTVAEKVDQRGRVLSRATAGPTVSPSLIGGVTSAMRGLSGRLPALPDPPVRAGETWSDSQPVGLEAAGLVSRGFARVTNRLDSLTQLGGSRAAAVSAAGTARYEVISPQFSMVVTGSSAGQALWDLDGGRLVRLSSQANG
jgi:hypothetical protein